MTQKSKLSDVIYENSVVLECVDLPPKTDVIAYLVNLMALIRTQTKTHATYEELALQLFMAEIPPGYKRMIQWQIHTEMHQLKIQNVKREDVQKQLLCDLESQRFLRILQSFCRMARTKPALLN